jgi:hypothetical protein
LTEQTIDQGHHRVIKDLVSIYANYRTTKFAMSLPTDEVDIKSIEEFRSLSEEIARYSFILKNNDLSFFY